MALIACSKCGSRVSTSAIKCPRCGTPPYTRNPTPQQIYPAGRPPSPAPRAAVPASDPFGEFSRILRGLRLNQLTPRQVVGGVSALLLAWWIFFSIPASPSYAIYTFYRNVNAHNGEGAAGFIDFPALTKQVNDDAMSAAAAQKDSDPGAEVLGRGILSLMSGAIADTVKSRFERMVENTDASAGQDKFTMSFGELVGVLWRLHRKGSTATSWFKDKKGNEIEITFVRQPDVGWRVTSVGGPGYKQMLHDQFERERNGGSPKMPPLKEGEEAPNV